MTNEERLENERIAEWFEARPTEPPPGPKQTWIATTSPNGWWQFDYRRDVWISRHDFHADESASAILRDAMPSPRIYRIAYNGKPEWVIKPDNQSWEPPFRDADYKRAIVGAFLLFMKANPKP